MVHVKLSEQRFISCTCLSSTQGRAQSFKVSVSLKQVCLKMMGQTTNMSRWILASIFWMSFIIWWDFKTESCCIHTICSSTPWKQGCELHVFPIFASVTSFSLPGQTCVYSQCTLPGWFEHWHFHCHMQHFSLTPPPPPMTMQGRLNYLAQVSPHASGLHECFMLRLKHCIMLLQSSRQVGTGKACRCTYLA